MTVSDTPPAAPAAGDEPDIQIDVTVEQPEWGELFAEEPDDAPEVVLGPVVRAALAAGGLAAAGRVVELGIVLGDDALAQRLNLEYRHIDAPTNVLSFPQRPGETGQPGAAAAGPDEADEPDESDGLADEEAPLLLGDIVLAYETVLAEAEEQGKAPLDHLFHLVVHGVLHLIGYDHETDAEAETMERLEADVLARFGIDDPAASDRPQAAPDRSQ